MLYGRETLWVADGYAHDFSLRRHADEGELVDCYPLEFIRFLHS